MFRATVANAVRHARIRDELDRNRDDLRRQFELQFATELDAMKSPQRTAAAAAGDLVTQLDSIDYLRRHRRLSVAETEAAIAVALDGVFAGS